MTPNEVISALDALGPSCARCRKAHREVLAALSDRRGLARKAAADRNQRRDWSILLSRAAEAVESQTRWAIEHLGEPHDAPEPHAAVVRKAPAPADERPECPRCGVRVELNARGRLRAHRGPSGSPCPRRLLSVDIALPAVVAPATPLRRVQPPRAAVDPSRLDAGSACEDCGRWLPGERRICGRCFVHRSTA